KAITVTHPNILLGFVISIRERHQNDTVNFADNRVCNRISLYSTRICCRVGKNKRRTTDLRKVSGCDFIKFPSASTHVAAEQIGVHSSRKCRVKKNPCPTSGCAWKRVCPLDDEIRRPYLLVVNESTVS